jgi:integrase
MEHLSSDIRQDQSTSLWYIDINEDGEKSLKTDESPRQVPIHPELERLEFIDFAMGASTNSGAKLFPNEKRNTRGEFGAYSKRFNRYRVAQGIKNTPATYLNYHSLRHTVQNDLLGNGNEQYVLNGLVGHTQAKQSQSVQTYSSGASLKGKRELFLKFDYKVKFTSRT